MTGSNRSATLMPIFTAIAAFTDQRILPMSVRLGIVMDPIERISYKKDSSLAML
ncbi:hypothetical protein GIV53_22125, partial [Pseudomonas syringae]|nr:hypothetical protein [Pseudomonas syringae]